MERFFAYARKNDGTAAPSSTITVYLTGTLNFASIFADDLPMPTPKSNPFTADADAFFYFYAAPGRYDVRVSGLGVVTPYTWADIMLLLDPDAAYTDRSNTFVGAQTITGNLTVTGSVTAGTPAVALITAAGKLAGLTSAFLASLDASTLTGLNAAQLASGILPDARLSGTYTGLLLFTNSGNTLKAARLDLGTTPAQSGSIRLSFGDIIKVRDGTNTADLELFSMVSGDRWKLSIAVDFNGSLAPFTDDTYNFGDTTRRWRNAHIKDSHNYGFLALYGALSGGKPAASGVLRLPNAQQMKARNFADTADVGIIGVNVSNQVEIGDNSAAIKWNKAKVALGGGAAPTFGTIGATGPTAAAQNAWLPVILSDGVAGFVPVWI